MALEVTETWSDWSLVKMTEGWKATRGFQITGHADDYEAINAPGVPVTNDQHPLNSYMKAKQPTYKKQGPRLMKCLVDYSFGEWGATDNPLNKPIEVEWGEEIESEPWMCDLAKTPLVNSAGTPLLGLSKPRRCLTLTAYRNLPFFDFNLLAFQDSTNSGTIIINGAFTLPPKQGLCTSVKPQGRFKIDPPYVTCVWKFKIRGILEGLPSAIASDPWQEYRFDVGSSGWYDDGTTFADIQPGPIVHGDGRDAGDVLLDGTGKPLNTKFKILSKSGVMEDAVAPPADHDLLPAAQKLSIAVGNQTVHVLKFFRFGPKDWTQIGLG